MGLHQEEVMRAIMDCVLEFLPNGMGATILTFNYGDEGTCNYISSAKREGMIKTLRETADRIEKNNGIIGKAEGPMQ